MLPGARFPASHSKEMSEPPSHSPSDNPAQQDQESFQRFYDGLFRSPAGAPDKDYKAICETWQKHSDACSVFLWLCQDTLHGRVWHLVAFGAKSGLSLPPPKALWHNGSEARSIAEYCAVRKEAWFIHNPIEWEADPPPGTDPASGSFKTKNVTYFQQIGCQSVIAVPLIRAADVPATGADETLPAAEEVVGAICLHFTRPFRVVLRSVEDDFYGEFAALEPDASAITPGKKLLELLGRLTAQELLRSREVLQKRTLLRLNELAAKWLVASSRTPEKARQE